MTAALFLAALAAAAGASAQSGIAALADQVEDRIVRYFPYRPGEVTVARNESVFLAVPRNPFVSRYLIYRRSEPIEDPFTLQETGFTAERIAEVKTVASFDDYTVAELPPEEIETGVKAGDLAIPVQEPVPYAIVQLPGERREQGLFSALRSVLVSRLERTGRFTLVDVSPEALGEDTVLELDPERVRSLGGPGPGSDRVGPDRVGSDRVDFVVGLLLSRKANTIVAYAEMASSNGRIHDVFSLAQPVDEIIAGYLRQAEAPSATGGGKAEIVSRLFLPYPVLAMAEIPDEASPRLVVLGPDRLSWIRLDEDQIAVDREEILRLPDDARIACRNLSAEIAVADLDHDGRVEIYFTTSRLDGTYVWTGADQVTRAMAGRRVLCAVPAENGARALLTGSYVDGEDVFAAGVWVERGPRFESGPRDPDPVGPDLSTPSFRKIRCAPDGTLLLLDEGFSLQQARLGESPAWRATGVESGTSFDETLPWNAASSRSPLGSPDRLTIREMNPARTRFTIDTGGSVAAIQFVTGRPGLIAFAELDADGQSSALHLVRISPK